VWRVFFHAKPLREIPKPAYVTRSASRATIHLQRNVQPLSRVPGEMMDHRDRVHITVKISLLASWFAASLFAIDANATSIRTFVASIGSDTNPCSLSAPCRSLQAAHDVTNDGGEIVVLDSAGYGALAIGKSISINAPAGVYAGISSPNGNGVQVSGFNISVSLAGLSFNGAGSVGAAGVLFAQGANLYIERCVVSGYAMGGVGIRIAPGAAAAMVRDSIVRDNTDGIVVDGSRNATVVRTLVERNSDHGFIARDGARLALADDIIRESATGVAAINTIDNVATIVGIERTLISDTTTSGIEANNHNSVAAWTSRVTVGVANGTLTRSALALHAVSTGANALIVAADMQIYENASAARASGVNARVTLDHDLVTRNVVGAELNGGVIATRANSTFDTNGTDVTGGTLTPLAGQ
jgi:hypothetical protein